MKPPPPSPALARELQELKPVKTRKPWRDVVLVAVGSLLWGGAWLMAKGTRPDLFAPATRGLVLAAALGVASWGWLLVKALVPPPGDVLSGEVEGPWPRRACALLAVFAALGVGTALEAPGSFLHSTSVLTFLVEAGPCFLCGLVVALGPALLCVWSARRLLVLSGHRLPLALGASAGSLAGAFAALHCASTDPRHVLLVHGALVLVPVVAAWLASRSRRGRDAPLG